MSDTKTQRTETTVGEDEHVAPTARSADTGVEPADTTTTTNTEQVSTDSELRDDAVLEAGDPAASGSRGEQASERMEDLSRPIDSDGQSVETPDTWDPTDTGLSTPGDFSDLTGLGGTEDPFEEPFAADDPASWGEAFGIGPDGTPLDDAGGFTPGDLEDALSGQREGLADGIIDETGIGPSGADAFGSGSELPDPTGYDHSDPRGTPSVTDAAPDSDPRISDETAEQGPNDGETFDFSKPQPDGSIINGVPLPGPNGETPPTKGTVEGKIWNEVGGGEGHMGEQTGGTAGGPRGTPNPDAPIEQMPDGLDVVMSGAVGGPSEIDPFDSLVQHQDPGDSAVYADAAGALMNKLASPLDPYTYPADDDGEVPDGLVLPGGGIEQTDPFDSLVQPSGPDTGPSDPSSTSLTDTADGYSESVDDAWDGLEAT